MLKKESQDKSNHLFEGRVRAIEKELVDYRKARAEYNEVSTRVAIIMTYLSIHGQLTQQQLKELTQFSISTISTHLTNLVNIRYVKKEMVKGTHEYIYSSNFPSDDSVDEALGDLIPEINFLKEKIAELEMYRNESLTGSELLHTRLTEITQTFGWYQAYLRTLKNSQLKFNKSKWKFPSKKLNLTDLENGTVTFDPKVKNIEDDLLEFFLHQSSYSVLKRYNLIIFVLFITRKILTQDRIQQLTGLSRGKISEALNYLVKKGYIEKIKKTVIKALISNNTARKNYYSLLSFHKSFIVTGLKGFDAIFKWESKFKDLKLELENDKARLHALNGYDKVLGFIKYNLQLMSLYRKAYTFISSYLD